jgi:hypothetical protein
MTAKLFLRALLALLWVSVFCLAQEITLAAAADLQFALPDIAARFPLICGERAACPDQHSGEPDLCELKAAA